MLLVNITVSMAVLHSVQNLQMTKERIPLYQFLRFKYSQVESAQGQGMILPHQQ